MKSIHRIQRANTVSKYDMKQTHVVQKEAEWQRGNYIFHGTSSKIKTASGERVMRRKKMVVKRCACGRRHWGMKNAWLLGKQKDVARLCPDCFFTAYGERRPQAFRYLTLDELQGILSFYAATGCKIIEPGTVDKHLAASCKPVPA